MTANITDEPVESKPCIKGQLHFLPCAKYHAFSHGVTVAIDNPETFFLAMDVVLTNEEVTLENRTYANEPTVRHVLYGNVKGRQCVSFELSEDEIIHFSELMEIPIQTRHIEPVED